MGIDHQALWERSGLVPPDGKHNAATLERASLRTDFDPPKLITEWSSGEFAWESWNRFDTTGTPYTRDLLVGLGIKRTRSDDELEAALEALVGHTFEVRTTSQQGSQGDRWFVNTYVDGVSADRLPAPGPDLPTGDGASPEQLDAEPAHVSPNPADDDIPF